MTSFLIDEGLIHELVAGHYDNMRCFGVIYVSVKLTKEGLKQYEDVCEYIFKYIKQMQEIGTKKEFFDELKIISEITFDFKNKEKPEGYIVNLAKKMHDFPIENVLVSSYLMKEYK